MTGPNDSRTPDTLASRFRHQFLSLVQPKYGEGIVVAFSGGADSTALMHLLHGLRDELKINLFVAHLNHGLRGQAGEMDRQAAEEAARRLGLPFHVGLVNCRAVALRRGLSLEEAAREARYRFLQDVRDRTRARYIATGHTADDNAESVLLNLIRGAGPSGLAGIPPVRGTIVRPLLDFWKKELIDFLIGRGLGWVEDQSNKDLKFQRNRVRNDLLPRLERHYNKGIKAALVRTARLVRDEEAYWSQHLSKAQLRVGWARSDDRVGLKKLPLASENRALARRLVRAAIRGLEGSVRSFSLNHVEMILDLAAEPNHGRMDLPAGLKAWVEDDFLYIGRRTEEIQTSFEYDLPTPGRIAMAEIGLELEATLDENPQAIDLKSLKPDTAVLDLDKLTLPLKVRNLKPGDRFQPIGLEGTKKLSDFFIDSKVPAAERGRAPIVLDAKGIVWIGGHRLADRVKITASTKTALVLVLRKTERIKRIE